MQPSNVELERQVRERTAALEAAYRQIAKQENDLHSLEEQFRSLMQQLAAERRRAESLVALSDRLGVR